MKPEKVGVKTALVTTFVYVPTPLVSKVVVAPANPSHGSTPFTPFTTTKSPDHDWVPGEDQKKGLKS